MVQEFGPLQNPRLCIYAAEDSLQFKWQVWFRTISSGTYTFGSVQSFLDQLSTDSGYRVCPGIREYPPEVRFKTKHLREWGLPFNRIDSDNCLLWHIPNNRRHPCGDRLRDGCASCRRLDHDIQQLLQSSAETSEAQKSSRGRVGSNYPLKYLSPASKAERTSRIIKESKNLSAKLSAQSLSFKVNDRQHHELLEITRAIHRNGSNAVEELCARGDQLGAEHNALRAAWKEDVQDWLDFEKDQSKCGRFIPTSLSYF